MEFKDKVIFIISYESWGAMRMSKHHYAIQLGKAGNEVYFINHPDKRHELTRGQVKVYNTDARNVFEVRHRLFHPYFLKFRYNALYNVLTRLHIQKIIRKVGVYPDIVWSFDTGNTIPLKYFPKSDLRILMPVDGPFWHQHEMRSAHKADVIVSVTNTILKRFQDVAVPKLEISHGVADVFLINDKVYRSTNRPVRIGYSGSLLRGDIDSEALLKIVAAHPDKIFELWGEADPKKSHIHQEQDVSAGTLNFLDAVRRLPNVKLHGAVMSEVLADGLKQMDACLICYNIRNNSNSHKVLEYLATGNVVISSYIDYYASADAGLIEMVEEKESNHKLPELFDKVIGNLDHYNSAALREMRIKYATRHSYSNNISRIEGFINRAKISGTAVPG